MRLWLKLEILSRFGSQRAFAQACNKSDDWVSKIVCGVTDPSEEEKKLIVSKIESDYADELFSIRKRSICSESS